MSLMRCLRNARSPFKLIGLAMLVAFVLILTWQIALAQAPQPNPLTRVEAAGNPIYLPVPGADITLNGAAVNIHGDPGRGRILFAQNCTPCHNDRGIGGVLNPGSDDGTVPALNPAPEFLEDSHGDPAAFSRAIDLFIQHGSRPSGERPEISMIGWGDHKLRTQPEIADLEAYIMQLNGVYWPDRFYPPAEVRMTAVRNGSTITYTINLINQGSGPLGDWTLRDTLPEGLAYIKSGLLGPDEGQAQVKGSSVEWVGGPNVPQGGSLGPFMIVAGLMGKTIPPNVAELRFTFSTSDGNLLWAGAVSDPILPVEPQPNVKATAKPATIEPLPTSTTAPRTATPPAETPSPATPISEATATSVYETPEVAVATSEATPTLVPETATPIASVPTPTNFSVNIVQPQPGALSWGFAPQSVTIHAGDTVMWTNAGSLVHSVTSGDGTFDSGLLNPGAAWGFVFPTAGTFSYHCSPHPWMKGTVIVLGAGQ